MKQTLAGYPHPNPLPQAGEGARYGLHERRGIMRRCRPNPFSRLREKVARSAG
jgi:hypothetical protein